MENKVGFIRRNLLTPIVEVANMEAVNQDLFGACEQLQETGNTAVKDAPPTSYSRRIG